MSTRASPAASDVPQLLAAFDSNDLVRPRFDASNVVDLATAIFNWAGVGSLPASENAGRMGAALSDALQLVILVVDGLGMNLIHRMQPASFLRRHLCTELQTVFPSTTSTVFTSLATAAWPNRHSIIGWDMYLEEIDAVATIIRFERRSDGEPLGRLGVREPQAYPVPSLLGAVPGDVVSVVPEGIANTPYSDYWTGHNAQYVTYETLDEGVSEVISRSCAARAGSITHFYTAAVDYASHEYGTNAPETVHALELVDAAVERLAARLPSDARIVLTADHGQLDGPTHEITPADPLVRHLRSDPWGDAREMHFAVKQGRFKQFEDCFRERYGQAAFLLTVDEVEALELLGPGRIDGAARKRLGTHLAISRGPDAFVYRAQPESFRFIGYHSGLTPDEMLVPLVVV